MNGSSSVKSLAFLASFVLAGLTILATADAPATPAPTAAPAASLLQNGGFEGGTQSWTLYVPDESKPANCRFDVVNDSPHSGASCARLQSDDFGRFCIGCGIIPVQPGEHYHVSVWIKGDGGTDFKPKTPGFAVRLHMTLGKAEAVGQHLFITPGNRVTQGISPAPGDPATQHIPTEWTQIEAVVEIPQGVDGMGPSLFDWWGKGTIYADDFSVEKVDASTPATPFWQKDGAPPANASK
jgi:hypothetical protein